MQCETCKIWKKSNDFYNVFFFSVVDYHLVDEATQDSDYTSDYESDVEDEILFLIALLVIRCQKSLR